MKKPLDIRVFSGLAGLNGPNEGDPDFVQPGSTYSVVWGVLSAVSAGVSGYHGYKRNNSLGWGVAWFLLGGLFPVITPTVAFAQGFGKRSR
jgi:hypothetical protein